MSRPVLVVLNVIYKENEQERLYLIGEHLDGHKTNLYAFPGGKVENESVEHAFWRELKEETGLVKSDDDYEYRCLEYIGNHEAAFKEKRFFLLLYAYPYNKDMGTPTNIEKQNIVNGNG